MTAPLVAANLGGIALFALAGLGIAELVPALGRLPWWRRLGFAYVLGIAVVGAFLFAASHLFGVALRRPAIAAAVGIPILAAIVARQGVGAIRARQAISAIGTRQAISAIDTRQALSAIGTREAVGAIGTRQAVGAIGTRQAVGAPESRGVRGARRGRSERWWWRRRGAGPPGEASDRGESARQEPAPRPRAARWQAAAGIAVAAIFLGTLASALSLPLGDWDGRLAWGAQAAYMRHEGTVDAAVLRQAPWFIVHPRYPPLLPLAQVAVQETFAARVDEELFRGVYAAFLAALLLILFEGAGRLAAPAAATLATLCAALPRFASFGMGSATSAYSDLPLACLYGAALVLLLLAAPRRATGLAAGCLLAGMVLAKNEGSFLAVVALVLAALRLWRPRSLDGGPWSRRTQRVPPSRRRRLALHRLPWLALAALPPLAAGALLAAWRSAIPNRFTTDFWTGLRPGDFVRGAAHRLPEILRGVFGETFHGANWYGFWALFLLVLLAGRYALRRPVARRLLAAGLAPLAIGLAAYCVNPTLGALIAETWSRFLIQGLVPLALVFAAALNDVLRQLAAPDQAKP